MKLQRFRGRHEKSALHFCKTLSTFLWEGLSGHPRPPSEHRASSLLMPSSTLSASLMYHGMIKKSIKVATEMNYLSFGGGRNRIFVLYYYHWIVFVDHNGKVGDMREVSRREYLRRAFWTVCGAAALPRVSARPVGKGCRRRASGRES